MQNSNFQEPRLRDTFKEDFKRKDLFSSLRKEFRELKQYFFNDYKKEELKRMGAVKRFFVESWWLFKLLFLRLTPLRRILLLIGVVLVGSSGTISLNNHNFIFGNNNHIFGGILILFVLMLELKDKLLAKTELQEGKAVQRALMPDSNPSLPGLDICLKSIPANDVGGDLIDFFQIEENKYALVLGDLSGKGLGAALMMSKLQSTIRALYQDYTDGAQLLEKVNKIFFRDSLPKQFASLIFIILDSVENTLELVNAGHLPPLSIVNNEVKTLSKGGIAIGLNNGSKYNKTIIKLNTDDEIVIFSDGITETMNEFNYQFGLSRLEKLIKKIYTLDAKSQINRILANLDLFRGEAPIHDDISLMIIKKTN